MSWLDGVAASVKRHPVAALGISAGVVGGLAVALATRNAPKNGAERQPEVTPTATDGAGVRAILERSRDLAGFDAAYVPFGLAAAWRESKFNPAARRTTEAEVDASCRGYLEAVSLYGPGREDEFCTGAWGWWQFHPSTAMKPSAFRQLDPRDYLPRPSFQGAVFADFVKRIVNDYFDELPPGERTYLSVRRAMASLGTMRAWDEDPNTKAGQRARDVRHRLEDDYAAVGYDPDLMWVEPRISGYPGAAAVFQGLQGLQGVAG